MPPKAKQTGYPFLGEPHPSVHILDRLPPKSNQHPGQHPNLRVVKVDEKQQSEQSQQ